MNKILTVFTALGLLSASAAMADEKIETTKTHETDGKKTTHSSKVSHKAGKKGNEVKSESMQKTEVSKP